MMLRTPVPARRSRRGPRDFRRRRRPPWNSRRCATGARAVRSRSST